MWTLGEATPTENFTHMPQQLPRACREGEEQGKNLTRTKENMKRKKICFLSRITATPPPGDPNLFLFFGRQNSKLEGLTKNVACGEGREIYKQPKNSAKFKTFVFLESFD